MSFRYRRRVKIFPGLLALNLSKSGVSASIGGRGGTINVNRRGHMETLSLPGSGVSYRTARKKFGAAARPLGHSSAHRGFWQWLIG
jgi:hypothetical protein